MLHGFDTALCTNANRRPAVLVNWDLPEGSRAAAAQLPRPPNLPVIRCRDLVDQKRLKPLARSAIQHRTE